VSDLEQQLRALSEERFESLVHQILVAKYPGADIKRVEGSGGDEGIDSFSGMLEIGPAIWQSKHFPDRIRDSQKKQIAKSISRAFGNGVPARWTLVVPINLRTAEHRWFQSKIVSAYGGPERIKLMHGSIHCGNSLRLQIWSARCSGSRATQKDGPAQIVDGDSPSPRCLVEKRLSLLTTA